MDWECVDCLYVNIEGVVSVANGDGSLLWVSICAKLLPL